jgi:hypothetical protein
LISEQEHIASTSGGLHQAAFWACLHQEVFTAFGSRRAINPALSSHFHIDLSLSPADDRVWAYRILVNCAHILAFCYGSNRTGESYQVQISPPVAESPKDERTAQWQALFDYTRGWHETKPSHFEPIFACQPTHESIFPIAHYHLPIQMAAAMYFYACMIMLSIHNPALNAEINIGPAGEGSCRDGIHAMRTCARTLRKLDEDVRSSVRTLCGMALSNCHLAPVMTVASTAVALCGEHFGDDVEKREKIALLDVLRQNETKHGWPTNTARRHLKALWNLD